MKKLFLFLILFINAFAFAGDDVKITTLKNGLRVVTKEVDNSGAVSITLAVKVGSRDETEKEAGISHFLEHMAFKGTTTRSSSDIKNLIENRGGSISAFTNREYTTYSFLLLKDDLNLGVDVLADIIQNSTIPEEEVEKEKQVILQEIAEYETNSHMQIEVHTYEIAYKNQSLAHSITGAIENIKKFTSKDILKFIKEKYNADKMVLTIVGDVEHGQAVKLAEEYFTKLNPKPKKDVAVKPPVYTGGEFIKKSPFTQVTYYKFYKGYGVADDKLPSLSVGSYVLGGNFSSRLFQEAREKRGLVYYVNSNPTYNSDSGLFAIFAGVDRANLKELKEVIDGEILKMQTTLVSKDEIQKILNTLKLQLLTNSQSISYLSNDIAISFLLKNQYINSEDTIKRFEKVTPESIQKVMKEVFSSPPIIIEY